MGDLTWDVDPERGVTGTKESFVSFPNWFRQEGLGQSSAILGLLRIDGGSEVHVNLRGFSECLGKEMSG